MSENVFEKALEIFRERGGSQSTLIDSDGRCCVLGAVALALGFDETKLVRGAPTYDGDYTESAYETPESHFLNEVATELWPVGNPDDWRTADAGFRWSYDVNDGYGPGAAEYLLEQAVVAAEASDE